jgi:hypothetical protein
MVGGERQAARQTPPKSGSRCLQSLAQTVTELKSKNPKILKKIGIKTLHKKQAARADEDY